MIAGGIGSTSFQNLGLSIAAERERGTLKRLRGTPMPPAAYFIGKIIQVFACTIAEVLVLVAVGMAFYHLHLPTSAGKWWTLAWVFVLGTVACPVIGIGISSLAASATNSFPVISLPFLVLQFISGIYVPVSDVPLWLQHIAAIFPLKWMSQGLRSVFLPARAAALEACPCLAARPDRAGAGGVDCRRIGAVPDDLPLADDPGRLIMPQCDETDGLADRPVDAWETGTRRWEILYGSVFLAVLAVVALSTGSELRTLIAISASAGMAVWYFLVGRPYLQASSEELNRRAVVYLAGILVLFGVAVLATPNVWFVSIALLPQIYQILPPRRALLPALSVTALGAASVAYWSHDAAGIGIAIALFAAIGAFTVAFGGYIGRIITQSGERASLIAQLEATRTELADVSRQAGVMAERQRLAGEIHDTLAQGFSSILMLIQAAETQVDADPPTARRQLGLAAQTARENLAEARTLVDGLAPAHLHAGTLEDALRRITERLGAEAGIETSFAAEGAPRRLPAATEVVLLRAGQEALANVRKHAAARSVAVRVAFGDGRVRLTVTDDGAGFDPALINGVTAWLACARASTRQAAPPASAAPPAGAPRSTRRSRHDGGARQRPEPCRKRGWTGPPAAREHRGSPC